MSLAARRYTGAVPRQVDHDERRREIAVATWRAIDELGVDGTTMRTIADRADCTIGRLNHYFANREELLVAALGLAHDRAAARMAEARQGRSGRDGLRAVLLEALPLDDERRTEWKVWLTFWAQALATESLRREHERRYRAWHRVVAELVADAAPAMGRSEIGRATEVLLATVDGLGIQTVMAAHPATPRRATATIDAALDALLARHGSA